MIQTIDPNDPEQFNENKFSHVDHFEWEENPEIKLSICYPKIESEEVLILLTGKKGSLILPISEINTLKPV